MTVSEMHIAFKFGMDKLDSLNYPNFLVAEIDLLLNQAQDRFVKQRYGVNNTKRQSFEETQKRTDDLKNLMKNASLTPSAVSVDNKPNGVFVTLPTTPYLYWFAVNEEALISLTDCNGSTITRRVRVRPIQHDDYNKVITDPFNQPYDLEVIRLMEDGQVELITDGNSTIVTYYLRYIKKPAKIDYVGNVSCELSEHTHQEIVDEAIRIALEGVEARRQQTFNQIENTNE